MNTSPLVASGLNSPMAKERMQARISLAVEWAKSNLNKIHSIDQMAEHAYLSRRSFDRQFRAYMGLSAKDWLTQCRLNLAMQYLSENKLSIGKIALLTGFGNSNNFRNNFVKLKGLSPSSFRREGCVAVSH